MLITAFAIKIPLSWENIRDFSVNGLNISFAGSDGIASKLPRTFESSAMHSVRISKPRHVAQMG